MKTAIFVISPKMLVPFLTKGRRSCTLDGIPEGSKYISATYDFEADCFLLKVEHESYDKVPEGGLSPKQYLTVADIILEDTEVEKKLSI